MAATSQSIPATDLTKRAANKPLVVGLNLAEIAYGLAAANFVTNTTGTLAAGDSSASGFGRELLVQRFSKDLWKGNAAATTWYLVIDQGTTEEWVDTLVIENHNFDGKTVTVEADGSTPAVPWTGATEVFSFTQSGSSLIFKLHASDMFKARYWRITVSGTSFTPQCSQVWLGKAVQFLHKSNRPYVPRQAGSGAAVVKTTKGGHRFAYVDHGHLEERRQQWTIAGTCKKTPVTDPELFLRDLVDFWTNARILKGGVNPFWYCEDPTDEPTAAKLVYPLEPDLRLVEVGPFETTFTLETKQQGVG